MTGLQRLPMDGDGWRDVLIIEQRMLRAIDTIVAFGPSAVAVLEPLVNDAPAKDAARVFALTMTLGCVAGRDALAAAERVFYAFEAADPTVRDGFADALKLIPHDHVHGLLTDWLRASDVHHRAIAIDVLGHRGAATEAQLLAAAEDDPVVAAMALPHLARLAPGRCGPPIDAALAAGADRLPLWQAMVLSDHRGTRMMLAEAVSNPELRGSPLRDGAARLLGVVGDRDDGASLADAMEDAPTPAGVEALGWIGDPKAFPVLLRLLEHEDELVGWAAGRALDRITGAWLVDLVELDAEEIHVELPPDPKVGYADEPLVKKVSDPRDVPAEPSKEMVERPSRDPARWSAWIAEHGQELRAGRRFRRGRPYAPQLTFDELDGPVATLQERALLATELVVRTGRALRFSPFDFVRVQEQSLEEWRPVAARSVTSGSWDRPGRR